ncbi:hypothetical protein [Nocardioides sp. LHG3406-4]|uniref:hypothetical protein n=1 Tax=Nocardioides sp. LHG3406-4 TaxID=2804575 RepID=UPI003CFAB0FA
MKDAGDVVGQGAGGVRPPGTGSRAARAYDASMGLPVPSAADSGELPTEVRGRDALRTAAVRATLAPSVLRTEPWRLVLTGTSLEVRADWHRRLRALDPAGRQLVISCGRAVLNARAALADADRAVLVERPPAPADPNLLALLSLLGEGGGDPSLARLAAAITDARTSAPPVVAEEVMVPPSVAFLRAAARTHDVTLDVVSEPGQLLLAARLSRLALLQQESDPACHAELRAWNSTPLEDGADPVYRQVMVILGTSRDTRVDWLRTGEALQQLALEARGSFSVHLLPHLIESPLAREELRTGMGLGVHPQVVLQLAPPVSGPATRRRRLVDVLSVED